MVGRTLGFRGLKRLSQYYGSDRNRGTMSTLTLSLSQEERDYFPRLVVSLSLWEGRGEGLRIPRPTAQSWK
jgi:hypothetical protein